MKTLGIVIPAYKKPKSLNRLLVSINKHTSRDLTDVIVVFDDGTNPDDITLPYEWVKKATTGKVGGGAIGAIWQGIKELDCMAVGVLGDDTELITPRSDEIITTYALNNPDSVFGLNDGIQNGRAHPFMSKILWVSGGGLPTCYAHSFGDTEIYKINRHHGKWVHIKECNILHHHPYSQKRGIVVEILEETRAACKRASRNDGNLHKRRMEWWENNCRPRMIPWEVGI